MPGFESLGPGWIVRGAPFGMPLRTPRLTSRLLLSLDPGMIETRRLGFCLLLHLKTEIITREKSVLQD